MAQFAVCLDTHPNSWGCRGEGTDQQVLSIPSGSRGTAPGAGRVLLALLLGERGCGKGWSQGKSLWGNPKPPPTAEPVDVLMESCKWNGCGDTGNPGSFPEKSVCSWDFHCPGSPVPPASPPQSCCSLAGKVLAVLCCCHCCCCCPRNCSQGGFKLGTFSNISISVVFKRLLVTQSEFPVGHMGRNPETPQCGCSLSNLPMFLCFLGPR